MNSRVVRAKLFITCDVIIDDTLIKNIEEQYVDISSDEEAGAQVLFAFLNPKLPTVDQLRKDLGTWDGVCDFKDRFKELQLSLDIE
ncbi:hypothetical protein ABNB59_11230 [Paenibacillus larvae]|uniref:Uncharacterized protein n=1 Tax=Paenibacillus larvae TaxID=1464 RepID=A0AAP5N2Q2_9BACL|nr:hypothetical protein [Paenibacillus larvae]AQR78088.1 hypothetical protein BXP28_12895 [Paenibacillus larvae subsp. larvae]AVF20736.1 hypothetical protein ERICI_00823 [Paenibacillus larvae subsp. larvae]ETK28299.1 hypothetical protein ERIC1_1c17610 [Paenibacillus larvae subsp. larvae DSM 25719]MCY7475915.1 hypothetical protein [Paenibacillus larvae]MCY7490750.1 hypothetical protein [Paenibacillus larvae]